MDWQIVTTNLYKQANERQDETKEAMDTGDFDTARSHFTASMVLSSLARAFQLGLKK